MVTKLILDIMKSLSKSQITLEKDFSVFKDLFYKVGGTDDLTIGKPPNFTKAKYVMKKLLRETYFTNSLLEPLYREDYLIGFKIKGT